VLIRKEDLIGGTGRYRFNMYIITVVTVHENHVNFSRGGSVQETVCLVCEYLAGGGDTCDVDGMCLYARW